MGETFIYWSQSSWYIRETYKVLENVIPGETLPAWTEMNNNNKKRQKKASWSPKLSRGETGWYYCSVAYIWYHFIKNEKNNSGGGTTRQEGGTSSSDCRAGMWTHCSQSLKPDRVCLAGFWNCLGSVTQLLFSSLPFWHEVSVTTILCQSYYCQFLLGTANFPVSWVQN